MDPQRAAEVGYPISCHHFTQGDSAFLSEVREVVEAYFCDGIQGTKAFICDPS
jgi:hypothetical protein